MLLGLGALLLWRRLDGRADARAWHELLARVGTPVQTYDPAMVSELPAPARRYFDYMIEPGTPLQGVVELDMIGQLALGTNEVPDYRAMKAHQVLAPPHGLVWQLESGSIGGSDAALPGRSWTRFWLAGLVPIARAGDRDHRRSAFGRVVAEAAAWAPASLLPGEHVRWEAVAEDRARAIVRYGDLEQAVDIQVDRDGAPIRLQMQRWSNENADREFREQPFGAELSGFRRFGGYRLPMRVEVGNLYGTPDYFPFIRAEVSDIRFPGLEAAR